MNHPEMRNTVFGKVLGGLLDARGIPVTPFTIGELAENADLNGREVIDRMANAVVGHVGDLDRLADALGMSDTERLELALAYTFEDRIPTLPGQTKNG